MDAPPPWEIATTRLRLRPLKPSDAAQTAALTTREISRWTATWPATMTPEQAGERIEASMRRAAESGGVMLAIERAADGLMLGWIGLYRFAQAPRKAVLGYWLGEPFHGQGYMTEAVGALVAEAWRRLDIDVIEAGANPANVPSIAILKRLGMRPIGGRMEFIPVRGREELTAYFQLDRPTA